MPWANKAVFKELWCNPGKGGYTFSLFKRIFPLFSGVSGMALIQSEIVRAQVVTAKCSEPQPDTIKVGVKEVE